MRPTDLLQALTVILIWGLNFVVIKTAVNEIPPMLLTTLRFALVALLVAPFFHPRRDEIRGVLWLSLVMGVGHFGLLFIGLQGADAATSALMIQLGIPFSVILSTLLFSDRLGPVRLFGMGMAFAGAALLAGEPEGGTALALGALLISAFCWAWSNVLIKHYRHIRPMVIIGWMSLFSTPLVALASLSLESGHLTLLAAASWKAWAALGYIAIGSSIIAYYLWYRLIGRLSINQVVPFSLLAPVIGVAAGVLLLNEAFTLYKALGGLLTLGGVAVIEWRQAVIRRRTTSTDRSR